MLRSGLVSITFRQLNAAQIVELVAKAGLEGIEWGGDVHVPPGDVAPAREIAKITRDAGLHVAAYGSYYRCGGEAGAFERVLESAAALGADLIRVWAGKCGSDVVSSEDRPKVIADARRICELAQRSNIRIASEWHGGTLTDTRASAAMFIADVNHPNLFAYWQPRSGKTFEVSFSDIDIALPLLAGVHVFHWDPADETRLPLEVGELDWKRYLARLKSDRDIFAMLEFVRNDSPEQFLSDAAVLRRWIADI